MTDMVWNSSSNVTDEQSQNHKTLPLTRVSKNQLMFLQKLSVKSFWQILKPIQDQLFCKIYNFLNSEDGIGICIIQIGLKVISFSITRCK